MNAADRKQHLQLADLHDVWTAGVEKAAARDVMALGTPPLIGMTVLRRLGSGTGIAATSACMYGCCGLAITSRGGPVSTMLPRYMMAVVSHTYE